MQGITKNKKDTIMLDSVNTLQITSWKHRKASIILKFNKPTKEVKIGFCEMFDFLARRKKAKPGFSGMKRRLLQLHGMSVQRAVDKSIK